MANWFDDITRELADEKLSRRKAMQRMAGALAGVAAASLLPGIALAQEKRIRACKKPGNCNGQPYPQCSKNNANCYCFTRLDNGKGACGCNMYCNGFYGCGNNAQCTKGWFCATSIGCTCSSGWCIQSCNKTCHLGVHKTGLTAALS